MKLKASTSMTAAQKVMMRDFQQQFSRLIETYWNPNTSDEYWDSLTDEAMSLLEKFQTSDTILNGFLSNLVAAFLNSREDIIS